MGTMAGHTLTLSRDPNGGLGATEAATPVRNGEVLEERLGRGGRDGGRLLSRRLSFLALTQYARVVVR